MTETDMPVHPVADLFPMLPEDELADLAANITENGLLHPIVLDKDGCILDGRNRYAACQIACIEPTFTTYDGDSPERYALSVNIARRNMTKGQQAMVVACAEEQRAKEEQVLIKSTPDAVIEKTSQRQLATALQIDHSYFSRAETVLVHARELVAAVIAGSKALNEAYAEARRIAKEKETREEKAAEANRQLRELRQAAPDLADLVAEERMSFDDAWAAHEKRLEVEAANAAQSNTALARAVSFFDGTAIDEWRTRTARYWAMGGGSVPPTAEELVTAANLRRIAKGLRLLADEME